MKKLIALLMAAVMLLTFAACGQTTAPATEPAAGATEGTAAETNAPQEKFVIGICQLITHDALDAATEGFIARVTEELGEENVEFVVEIAAGDSATCASIVNAFVADGVDLIMANATPALQAAAAATEDIPVLGTSITEYGVALDLKDFNGVVGTNVSGTSDLAPLDQQAAMVTEWFPEAKNVGLLYCSAEPNSKYQVETVKAELEKAGLTAELFAFADTNDLQSVTQAAADASDVIYVPTDNAVASAAEIVDGICSEANVPVIAGEEGICKVAGVATLSISYYDLGIATGAMAVEILRDGADVTTMEIGYADAVKKYNAEICEKLGLTVPEGYIAIEG